ncbi:TPA: hypothetical protein DEP96_00580 [Candidatus Uhrbacteria bacterium]|nr:hypothetical protein [Candidatus Uhrbacteria bacterium]
MAIAKKRAPVSRAKKSVASVAMQNTFSKSGCDACNSLPVGSIELTALMLVLVFSLSAVLFTSVFALQTKNEEIKQLQSQVSANLPVSE